MNIKYMLQLHDLKQQGLTLSKSDAMELHSPINEIAQRGGDKETVFTGNGEDLTPKEDPLKAYYTEIRQRNSELLKENFDLKKENDLLKAKPSFETGKKIEIEYISDTANIESKVKSPVVKVDKPVKPTKVKVSKKTTK